MKNRKNIILFVILIIVVVSACFLTKYLVNKEPSVYYRTYTKENGWSKWVKNGETSGNKKNDILNVEIKVKRKKLGVVTYSVYSNNDWSKNSTIFDTLENNKNINGIKIGRTNKLNTRYDICYRTYNKENKWLEWTCNGSVSGNKNENINALEVKIIPKNIIKFDYLKDYNTSNYGASLDF